MAEKRCSDRTPHDKHQWVDGSELVEVRWDPEATEPLATLPRDAIKRCPGVLRGRLKSDE